MLSGRLIDLDQPEIHIEDVAVGLANICRWGGQVKRRFSVAEHSLAVARLVRWDGGTPRETLGGLMHDAHEAYLGDVVTPLKQAFGDRFAALADQLDVAVADAVGISRADLRCAAVKVADEAMLHMECAALRPDGYRWLADPSPAAARLIARFSRSVSDIIGWSKTPGEVTVEFTNEVGVYMGLVKRAESQAT